MIMDVNIASVVPISKEASSAAAKQITSEKNLEI